MKHWTAQGVVAVILATSLGGAFIAVYVIAALAPEETVNSAAVSAVEHLGTLLATGLAGWLGGSAVAKGRDHPHGLD